MKNYIQYYIPILLAESGVRVLGTRGIHYVKDNMKNSRLTALDVSQLALWEQESQLKCLITRHYGNISHYQRMPRI